jgi:hypothetical protein
VSDLSDKSDWSDPGATRARLVRLGRLTFDDFCLLDATTARSILSDESGRPDWSAALAGAPHVLARLRHRAALASSLLPSDFCALTSDLTLAAQETLVHRFALELLREKAPPLYDALPWHDWDFSVVTREVRVWQTRFLFTGCGTTVGFCRPRRSAGVCVVEPVAVLRRYIERKAKLEKVKSLRGVSGLSELPDRAVDMAVIGGSAGVSAAAIAELDRVAGRVLIVDNDPLAPPMPEDLLRSRGFRRATVSVRGLGSRPCWWWRSRAAAG